MRRPPGKLEEIQSLRAHAQRFLGMRRLDASLMTAAARKFHCNPGVLAVKTAIEMISLRIAAAALVATLRHSLFHIVNLQTLTTIRPRCTSFALLP
jgi:hypothetical protein